MTFATKTEVSNDGETWILAEHAGGSPQDYPYARTTRSPVADPHSVWAKTIEGLRARADKADRELAVSEDNRKLYHGLCETWKERAQTAERERDEALHELRHVREAGKPATCGQDYMDGGFPCIKKPGHAGRHTDVRGGFWG